MNLAGRYQGKSAPDWMTDGVPFLEKDARPRG